MNRRSNTRTTTRTKKATTTRASAVATPTRSSALSVFSASAAPVSTRTPSTKAKLSVMSSSASTQVAASEMSATTTAKRFYAYLTPSSMNVSPVMTIKNKPTSFHMTAKPLTTTAAPQYQYTTMAAPVAPKTQHTMQFVPQRKMAMSAVAPKKIAMMPSPVEMSTAAFTPSPKMVATLMAYRAMSTASANDPRNLLRDPKEVESRILNVLKSFEKIDQSKLAPESHFQRDLGLDSLDRVEVMLAVEEEFNLEFSDEVSDRISSVKEAVDHISQLPDHEFKFSA